MPRRCRKTLSSCDTHQSRLSLNSRGRCRTCTCPTPVARSGRRHPTSLRYPILRRHVLPHSILIQLVPIRKVALSFLEDSVRNAMTSYRSNLTSSRSHVVSKSDNGATRPFFVSKAIVFSNISEAQVLRYRRPFDGFLAGGGDALLSVGGLIPKSAVHMTLIPFGLMTLKDSPSTVPAEKATTVL